MTPLTEPSQNPSKPENQVTDTSSSEFKPYSFYVDDEIDIATHKERKLGALEDIETVPTVIEDIAKTLHTAPSVIKHTSSTPETTSTPSSASSQVTTNTTSKTSRVNDQFCLKNPPFKLKKRIEMRKASTLRVGAGYCYGLEDGNDLVI